MSLPSSLLILGLTLSFGLPVVGIYRRRRDETTPDWEDIRRILRRNWVMLIALVSLVAVTGTVSDLGVRIPAFGVLVDGLLFGFIAFAGTMLLVGLVLRAAGGVAVDAASLVVFEQPAIRRVAVAVTGAVVETTLFFGFAVEALFALGAAPWTAGAAGALGVLLVRAQWSIRNALQWLPGAIVLAGIALWSRTVLVVLGIRLVYDTITLVSGDASDYVGPADE